MPKRVKAKKIENLFDRKLKINEEALERIIDEIWDCLINKNIDYGCENILILGEKGVFARVTDKFFRLRNLVWREHEGTIENETVEDTWLDLAGYAIIGLMLRRDVFAVEEKK